MTRLESLGFSDLLPQLDNVYFNRMNNLDAKMSVQNRTRTTFPFIKDVDVSLVGTENKFIQWRHANSNQSHIVVPRGERLRLQICPYYHNVRKNIYIFYLFSELFLFYIIV